MSDFLSALLARSLNVEPNMQGLEDSTTLPRIQPRLRSRFENAPDFAQGIASDVNQQFDVYAESVAPPHHPAAPESLPSRPVSSTPEAPVTPLRQNPPTVASPLEPQRLRFRERDESHLSVGLAAEPSARPIPGEPRAPGAPPTLPLERLVREIVRERLIETPMLPAAIASQHRPQPATSGFVNAKSTALQRPSGETVGPNLSGAAVWQSQQSGDAEPGTIRRRLAEPPLQGRNPLPPTMASTAPQQTNESNPSEPTIRVSIGRVEVRAVMSPPAPRSTQPAAPQVSLDDYLRAYDAKYQPK